ncbi:oxidoreductase [Pseudonocardia sp. GCM10023141]|uniref:oxidoreductase n=1 Tax=Pseudonocardia sp. GCM10023141 TaxID=3252653 RepID=UPI00361DDED0
MTTTNGSRRWLITGANSGFGLAIAQAALAAGDVVVAGSRKVEALDGLVAAHPGAVTAVALDVTDPEQVAAAATGEIDVLVNNAGHGLLGALEELTDEQLRRVLETNVFGALAMTRAVLPGMRARRRGHIVQMSSVGGVVGNPGHAAYATSKFALEGASEALAAEVAPFGIRVTIVEPGPFRTDFAGRSMTFAEAIPDYADTPAGALRSRFRAQDGVQPGDPARGAAAILATVRAPSAPLRLPLGVEAVTRIRAKLQAQLADLDVCADLSQGTAYADQ